MPALQSEKLIPLKASGELFGSPPSPSTLHRWTHEGVRGHVLWSKRIGAKVFTTEKAVADFLEACNAEARDAA